MKGTKDDTDRHNFAGGLARTESQIQRDVAHLYSKSGAAGSMLLLLYHATIPTLFR